MIKQIPSMLKEFLSNMHRLKRPFINANQLVTKSWLDFVLNFLMCMMGYTFVISLIVSTQVVNIFVAFGLALIFAISLYFILRYYVKSKYGWYMQSMLSKWQQFVHANFWVIFLVSFEIVIAFLILSSMLPWLRLPDYKGLVTNRSIGLNVVTIGITYAVIQPLMESLLLRGYVTWFINQKVQNRLWQFLIPVLLGTFLRSASILTPTMVYISFIEMALLQFVRMKYDVWTTTNIAILTTIILYMTI